jgi:dihydroorotate dehydrogenase
MKIFGLLYKIIFKPIAFQMDPEFVHDYILFFGKWLGKSAIGKKLTFKLFNFQSSKLEQKILGINFNNPIGLSAGFDKNAELLDILPSVGFGFAEVGSITGEACAGNPKKRLWRLPNSRSLVVNYGLKNDGAEVISKRLTGKQFVFPVGINVAKTNNHETVDRQKGIQDYVKAYRLFANVGDYTTINISCPNTFGGQPFTDPESLELLLTTIDAIPSTKPVFIKFSPDMGMETVDALLEVISRHKVHGLVCTNLTKKRDNPNILDNNIPGVGGLSGKVVEELSNQLIAYVYKKTQGKYVIVGCGGVFTAEDAYKKIRLGASLIQLITGMVFLGPQVIGEINLGLVKLLEQDGFNNISQAIGVDNPIV